jgi:hypothetical protein
MVEYKNWRYRIMDKKEILEQMQREISWIDRDILQALMIMLLKKGIVTEEEINQTMKNIKEERIRIREEEYERIGDNRYGV